VPLVASFPDQPPEAVQLVALLEDQVRVVDEPWVTLGGLARRLRLGLGVVSVTWTVSATAVVPLAPLQVSVKAAELVMAPVLALPLVALLPDQPPEAVQLVALLEDQTRVADEPRVTSGGVAIRLRVGLGGVPPLPLPLLLLPPPPQPTANSRGMKTTAKSLGTETSVRMWRLLIRGSMMLTARATLERQLPPDVSARQSSTGQLFSKRSESVTKPDHRRTSL
jgi:hypothetical protein